MTVPANPKIYHIVHVDRLPSIIASGGLWSDAEIIHRPIAGTTIGMSNIKERRLQELTLASHTGLYVGQCVPFYFCPRSIMLYIICQANHPELSYKGGQGPIIHLQSDLRATVEWATQIGQRWAFSLSNAGSVYFEDRCNLALLNEIDWEAVQARNWQSHKHGKQAEFLLERFLPWELTERIGVHSGLVYQQVADALQNVGHYPAVAIEHDWYY